MLLYVAFAIVVWMFLIGSGLMLCVASARAEAASRNF